MKLPIERVPCKCGDLEGVLILRRSLIEVEDANGNVRILTHVTTMYAAAVRVVCMRLGRSKIERG